MTLQRYFLEPLEVHDAKARYRQFFARMQLIRLCEEKLLALFGKGVVRGTVHTCLGQEACAVGVVNALDRSRDIVCSNHRGHGHYLAYCGDVDGLLAEVLGLPGGVCGGVGGSQHLHRDNFYTNGILGGMPPVATGMAAAEAYLETGRVVCVFLGDGAMAEGSLYEALNLAGLWKLPILFAVEHNQYAQSTHWQAQHAGALDQRAETFGVKVATLDGNDVEAVYQAAAAAVARLRSGLGPEMLFLRTYRLGPHSKGDDLRPAEELAEHWVNEPLAHLRRKLDGVWIDDLQAAQAAELETVVEDLLAVTREGR